jgi:hypothetical protein
MSADAVENVFGVNGEPAGELAERFACWWSMTA